MKTHGKYKARKQEYLCVALCDGRFSPMQHMTLAALITSKVYYCLAGKILGSCPLVWHLLADSHMCTIFYFL